MKKWISPPKTVENGPFPHSCDNPSLDFISLWVLTLRTGEDKSVILVLSFVVQRFCLYLRLIAGQGFDRHLFFLRILTESTGKVPEIFQDRAYKPINHIILSTSTLSSPALMLGGFGPVVRDGFGVSYGIQDDWLGYNVTSYPPNTDVCGYLECLRRSLEDIYSILEGKNFKQLIWDDSLH